ncbi:hypothetical protein [Paraburkholderia sp. BL10I2N1]|uniref:hypothetical protein n=1 Tax=Paraburkholderia sp. BL10I2N1 TaxID=1938796 RepID=UPI0010614387|nr:hypothetical protein [Paraburkholderia sp. BL10I2N1]TDN59049.1 hypothetical protein B0G77_8235 [Paraburkholderia sp. BL10I2N1]
MGATVITGKRAAAFHKADGELAYVLFERTYEKNVVPHHDRWSAVAFGSREAVLRRVFAHAAACCGGILQSRSGDIKPENFIEAWKRELAHPVPFDDTQIRLEIAKSFSAAIPVEKAEEARLAMIRSGFEKQYDGIVKGGFIASLHADADLLLALYGEGHVLAPWRIFDAGDCRTVPFQVPVPKAAKDPLAAMPKVRCLAVDSSNLLMAIGSMPWRESGWAYSALQDFVTDVAYARELEFPGFAAKAIPIVREALRDPEPVPGETNVTVRRDASSGAWHRRSADELAQRLGHAAEGAQAPEEFSFRFSQLSGEHERALKYKLCSLDASQVHWDVPAVATAIETADLASQFELCLA